MTRLSAITPSGHAHLGNHLGAIRRWAREGSAGDLYFVSDLHAMTVSYNPSRLRVLSRELLAVLLAAGIKPDRVFVQSDLVRELGALSWVLECTCSFGEAARMTQFKQRADGQGTVRLGLLTYPVLMAADILLQGATEVPVGQDQTQHVELARSLARRFNTTFGEVFVVPRAVMAPTAARVMDLSDPTRKMSKSTQDNAGVVFLLDEPDLVRRKLMRAVTDNENRLEYRPTTQPGLANLLEILAACVGRSPIEMADEYSSYGELKEAVAEAVVEELAPLRASTLELLDDPAGLDAIRVAGAERARERGQHVLESALRMAGLSG
ncbi:tryptophan--tRNA ligase [Actinokineospora globicatena]|uniref:tryptophan--tRNA ligase n=1 Tax=Actinokineospora globicatena TaxID=103729 RepID=UPI0020A384B1|nr:tryptophan--tRNA ligase [Actinokineospora globicatena]MCP2300487.1 tryptophanyl-tRNA synthetase [Actinokineospora globicatena]GLW81022.1 tryptophan--tRNA ligase [Actinokineospora globicatena]GLW88215.1 tryptophan--tRNA ligase [Actinokineospora globicatena]